MRPKLFTVSWAVAAQATLCGAKKSAHGSGRVKSDSPKTPLGAVWFPGGIGPVGYPESLGSGKNPLETPRCIHKGAQLQHGANRMFCGPCLGPQRRFRLSARRMGPFHVANQCV